MQGPPEAASRFTPSGRRPGLRSGERAGSEPASRAPRPPASGGEQSKFWRGQPFRPTPASTSVNSAAEAVPRAVRPPFRQPHHAWLQQFVTVEEPLDGRPGAGCAPRPQPAVVGLHRRGRQVRGPVGGGAVADHQVAAGRELVPQRADDLPGVFLVRQEVQHRPQQQAHRLPRVEQPARFLAAQDLPGFPQVGADHGGARIAVQDRPAVRHRDRVHVHVDDPRPGRRLLGDLVHVALGGDAGPDVEELADPGGGEHPHRAGEEGAVFPHDRPDAWLHRDERPGRVPVGLQVVPAAEPVVIDPGDARCPGVHSRRYPAQVPGHQSSLPPCPGRRAGSLSGCVPKMASGYTRQADSDQLYKFPVNIR